MCSCHKYFYCKNNKQAYWDGEQRINNNFVESLNNKVKSKLYYSAVLPKINNMNNKFRSPNYFTVLTNHEINNKVKLPSNNTCMSGICDSQGRVDSTDKCLNYNCFCSASSRCEDRVTLPVNQPCAPDKSPPLSNNLVGSNCLLIGKVLPTISGAHTAAESCEKMSTKTVQPDQVITPLHDVKQENSQAKLESVQRNILDKNDEQINWSNLPFTSETITTEGIYADPEDTTKPKTIGFINKDSMIKFGAALKGSTSENSVLTYLDTGAEESVAGPSTLVGLQPGDYFEIPKIPLNGPDGHSLNVERRIQFSRGNGLQIDNKEPVPLTLSILKHDSKSWDLLLALPTIKQMAPVTIVIKADATFIKFHSTTNKQGNISPALVTCLHPEATPVRAINKTLIHPLEQKSIRVLSLQPEVFFPIDPEKLPLPNLQHNFSTKDNGKCLKNPGTSSINLINNTKQQKTFRKGQTICIALNQNKTFIGPKENSKCPMVDCQCKDKEIMKEEKEKLEKIISDLEQIKKTEMLRKCIEVLEKKFKSNNENTPNLEAEESLNKKEDSILSNEYNLQERFQNESSTILRESTPAEKLQKQKDLEDYFIGKNEPCEELITIGSIRKGKVLSEEQKSCLKNIKICAKQKFECEPTSNCAHFNQNLLPRNKTINNVTSNNKYKKINPFELMETTSLFNQPDMKPIDHDVFNNLESVNDKIYKKISEVKKISISEEELNTFKQISKENMKKYVHSQEIEEFLNFFWHTFTEENQIFNLPQMPEGHISIEDKAFPSTAEILARCFRLVKKGSHFLKDPFLRIYFRMIFYRYRNCIAKFSWDLGTFSKKIYVHSRALKDGIHFNRTVRPYKLSSIERKQLRNYVTKLERLQLLEHVAKQPNAEIINIFVVKKHAQNVGQPMNYNMELKKTGLHELNQEESEEISRTANETKNVNVIETQDIDLENDDEGYVSDFIEEEENEEDQEEFLLNPTTKNYQNWHFNELEKQVLSINSNEKDVPDKTIKIEDQLSPRRSENGNLGFISAIVDSLQLSKKSRTTKKLYKHREVRTILRDMLTTGCKFSQEHQLRLFNNSVTGQLNKSEINNFQHFLEECKQYWTLDKSTSLSWPEHLKKNKHFPMLEKLIPYFLSETIGKSILIFKKKFGKIKSINRKDMDKFGLGKNLDKNDHPVIVLKTKYKDEQIWQPTTYDINLASKFQSNLYQNKNFKMFREEINEVMKEYEQESDEGYVEPQVEKKEKIENNDKKEERGTDILEDYDLPTKDETQKFTSITEEEQLRRLYQQKMLDEDPKFKNLRLVSNFTQYNSKTKHHSTILPTSESIKSTLGKGGSNASFSSMDANQWFFQIHSDDSYCDSLLFAVENYLYKPKNYLPQGDAHSPSAASFCSQYFIKGLEDRAAVLIDDIALVDEDPQSQLNSLEMLFKNIIKFSETAKTCRIHPSKMTVFSDTLNFAGCFIKGDRIFTETHKASKFLKYRPVTFSDLSSLLSYVSYFRNHISCLADKIVLMQQTLNQHSKHSQIEWKEDMIEEYQELVRIMDNLPALYLLPANYTGQLHIFADASKDAIGSLIAMEKVIDGKLELVPIQFLSRLLQGSEKNYSIACGELLSVMDTIQKQNHLFRGTPFVIHSDSAFVYNSISNLQTGRPVPCSTMRRLANLLEGYQFQIVYVKTHLTPGDHLSRFPLLKDKVEKLKLPQLEEGTCHIKMKDNTVKSETFQANFIKKSTPKPMQINSIETVKEQPLTNFSMKNETMKNEEKLNLVKEILKEWKFALPYREHLDRIDYSCPTQPQAQQMLKDIVEDYLWDKVTRQQTNRPEENTPIWQDIKDNMKTIQDSPTLLEETAKHILPKIEESQQKHIIWFILLKFAMELWFLKFDDNIKSEKEPITTNDSAAAMVAPIMTRGTPSESDAIFEAKDLSLLQRKDKKISKIINQIEKKPDNPSFRKEKENPRISLNGVCYTIINRVLLASKEPKNKKRMQGFKYVLPQELQLPLTYKKHNVGHLAVKNTLEAIQEMYFWNKDTSDFLMYDTAKKVAQSCLTCQFFSRRTTYINPKLQLLHMSLNVKCGQGLVIDIFEIGKDSGEKSHLAVSVCSRCRFTQAKALKTVNSKTISKFILQCIQVQIPQFILSDNASYFISKETKMLFEGLNGALKSWRNDNQDFLKEKGEKSQSDNHPNILDILMKSARGDISELFEKIPTNKNGSCLYRAVLCSQQEETIQEDSLEEQANDLRKKSMQNAKILMSNPQFRNKHINLPSNDQEKQKILDSIMQELEDFSTDPSKWTTQDRSIRFLEDIIGEFIATHIKKTLLVIKPDGSVTRITGFKESLDIDPDENPILLFLQEDHFEGIRLKKNFKNLPKILNRNFTEDKSLLNPEEVQTIVTDLITDNANNRFDFDSSDVEKIEHRTSSALYPQGHSLIERNLGSISMVLARLIQKHPEKWEDYLEQTVLVLNTKQHRSLGISPTAAHFRRLQREITPDLVGLVEKANMENLPSALSEMKNQLRIVQELFMEENITKYFIQQDIAWEKKYRVKQGHNFHVGQNVLIKKLLPSSSKFRKSVSFYGPGTVIELIGRSGLRIEFWISGFIIKRHFSHAQPFFEPLSAYEKYPDIQKTTLQQRNEFYNSPTKKMCKLFAPPLQSTEDEDIAVSNSGQLFFLGPLSEEDLEDKMYDFQEEESLYLQNTAQEGLVPDLSLTRRAQLLAEEMRHGTLPNRKEIRIGRGNIPDKKQQNSSQEEEDDDQDKNKKKPNKDKPKGGIRFARTSKTVDIDAEKIGKIIPGTENEVKTKRR